MDDSTIKHFIGHGSDSTVMETTYQHLSDDDYTAKAERAMGLREAEEASPLTPDICPTCGDQLAKACEGCGAVFTPDAKDTEEQVDEDL